MAERHYAVLCGDAFVIHVPADSPELSERGIEGESWRAVIFYDEGSVHFGYNIGIIKDVPSAEHVGERVTFLKNMADAERRLEEAPSP